MSLVFGHSELCFRGDLLQGSELQGRREVDDRLCVPFTILELNCSWLGPITLWSQINVQSMTQIQAGFPHSLLPPDFDSQFFNQ